MTTPIYFILVDFGVRLGEAWVERDSVDMTWQKTVRDISDEQWHGRVVRVLEIDRAAGTCRDVTQRAKAEAAALEGLAVDMVHVV